MKVKSVCLNSFQGDAWRRIDVYLDNGRILSPFGVWKRKDRLGTWYESDRFARHYKSMAEVKAHALQVVLDAPAPIIDRGLCSNTYRSMKVVEIIKHSV